MSRKIAFYVSFGTDIESLGHITSVM